MKTFVILAALAGLVGFGVSAPALAQGQAAGGAAAGKLSPAIVAIVDFQRIRRDASAFKSVRQQVDTHSVTFRNEIAKEEEKLRNEEQDLVRQRAVLSPEAFETKRKDFEQRVTGVQKRMQDRGRQVEVMVNNAQREIEKVLNAVVDDLARERGFNMVVDRSLLFWAADGFDVTTETLKRLDQKLPSVRVSVPAAGQ